MPEEIKTTEENSESGDDPMRSAFGQFMEHQRRAFEESGKAIDALLPDGFKEHSAAAREEFRKGLKVLVDAAIDELEKATKSDEAPTKDDSDDGPPPSTTGRNKVKVQVD